MRSTVRAAQVEFPSATATAHEGPRVRIAALISPSGHGNLGDEAILASTIENLRLRLPGIRFVGITLNPDDTRRRFGIAAFPIGGISRPGYLVCGDPSRPPDDIAATDAQGADRAPSATPAPDRRGTGSVVVAAFKSVLKRVLPRELTWTVLQEIRHLRAARRLTRDVDLVIVAGGGQIDDTWGGPWGQPYALFKWATLARLSGKPLMVASVGFGALRTPLSRWFVRRALASARYRSFRDEESLKLMRQVGHAHPDPVEPDLAFGLDRHALLSGARHSPGHRTICLSPMIYLDPVTWPVKDAAAYERYLDRLAHLATRLLADWPQVVLVSSDGPDRRSVAALYERLAAKVPAAQLSRVSIPDTDTVDRFLDAVARADVFVGSRLHGVLLALLAGTPVVALAYDRKVAALMRAMGLSAQCLGIDDFDLEAVVAQIEPLAAESVSIRELIVSRVRELSASLQSQFDRLLA